MVNEETMEAIELLARLAKLLQQIADGTAFRVDAANNLSIDWYWRKEVKECNNQIERLRRVS